MSATMRRLALAILLLAAPAFAQEPTKFTLQIASSSGGAGNVLGPGAPCTDDTVPTFDGATATQLQCSTLLYSADGDLTATRGVQGKWGLFQPTTDTTSLIARRQGAAQTSYVFQVQTEANAHVLGIGPTGTITGPSGGFTIFGGPDAADELTLDGNLTTSGKATISGAGVLTLPVGAVGTPSIKSTDNDSGIFFASGTDVRIGKNGASVFGTAGANLFFDQALDIGGYGDTGLVRVAANTARISNLSTGLGRLLTGVLVEANTAGSGAPNVLTAVESGTLLTNEGSTAQNYHTLVTAAAGICYEFVVQDADGLRVVANTGDTIRVAGTASAAAGYIQNSTIGGAIRLCAINATEWVAMSVVGTWTVDS